MTFYHFGNCLALAYVPYHLTYKLAGLSEYGAFWKCVTAGFIYTITQLAKMLFLVKETNKKGIKEQGVTKAISFQATFFPEEWDDEPEDVPVDLDLDVPFVFITEFLKVTVDLVDLIGLHLVMQRVAGKGQV